MLLQFEAQRPIDTRAIQHQLHFSHFSITNSLPTASVYTTMANFNFTELSDEIEETDDAAPASQALPDIPDPPQRFGSGLNASPTAAGDTAMHDAPSSSSGVIAGARGTQAYNMPADYVSRLRPSQHMSSIVDPRGPPSPILESELATAGSYFVTPRSSAMDRNRSSSRSRSSATAAAPVGAADNTRGRSDSVRANDQAFTFVAAPINYRDDAETSPSAVAASFPPAATEGAPYPFLQSTQWSNLVGPPGSSLASTSSVSSPSLAAAALDNMSIFSTSASGSAPSSSTMLLRPSRSRAESDGRMPSPPRYKHVVDSSLAGGPDSSELNIRDMADEDASSAASTADVRSRASSIAAGPRAASSRATSAAMAGPTPSAQQQHRAQGRRRRRLPRELKPAYGFQLDPLDSFETWILTLSVRRTDRDLLPEFLEQRAAHDAHSRFYRGPAFIRPFETERRLMEGLDRVYREWFRPPAKNEEGGAVEQGFFSRVERKRPEAGAIPAQPQEQSQAHTGISTARAKARLYQADMTDQERTSILPPRRVLELDNNRSSCQLRIQPHPCERFAEHPALAGAGGSYSDLGSHSWLSYASFSGANSLLAASHNRIELTFHCDEIQINAALLLSAFEMVERDLYAKKANAKLRAALSEEDDQSGDLSRFSSGDDRTYMRLAGRKGGPVFIDDLTLPDNRTTILKFV